MIPESSLNILISGSLALLGVILGVWLERHFHEKKVREGLFKALFEEITLNYSVAKNNKGIFKDYGWTVFELAPFYTQSYQNIRTSGELASLSSPTLSLLEETYELIYAHNRQTIAMLRALDDSIQKGLEQRIDRLEKQMVQLMQDLPKELGFLKRMG